MSRPRVVDAILGALPGVDVGVDDGFGPTTVTVPASSWIVALTAAARAGATFLDFLTAYEVVDTYAVVAHVSTPDARQHVLVSTGVPKSAPVLPTATTVYRGASWHERETAEMFGIDFAGHPNLVPLLLPDGFGAHPLRKDFVLASRVAKPWPGAKEPGEGPGDRPARRPVRPPGVPDGWGQPSSEDAS